MATAAEVQRSKELSKEWRQLKDPSDFSEEESQWGPAAHRSVSNSTGHAHVIFETSRCTWIFDEVGKRFRRLFRTPLQGFYTDWHSYDHVVSDGTNEVFMVFLDAAGTRFLRARRHEAECV
jgi:hypothetical protein